MTITTTPTIDQLITGLLDARDALTAALNDERDASGRLDPDIRGADAGWALRDHFAAIDGAEQRLSDAVTALNTGIAALIDQRVAAALAAHGITPA